MSDDPRLKPLIDQVLPDPKLRMTQAETEEWGQEKPPKPPLNLGMCAGVGKPGVERDGVWCCSVCGDPIEEGCGSSRWKAEA